MSWDRDIDTVIAAKLEPLNDEIRALRIRMADVEHALEKALKVVSKIDLLSEVVAKTDIYNTGKRKSKRNEQYYVKSKAQEKLELQRRIEDEIATIAQIVKKHFVPWKFTFDDILNYRSYWDRKKFKAWLDTNYPSEFRQIYITETHISKAFESVGMSFKKKFLHYNRLIPDGTGVYKHKMYMAYIPVRNIKDKEYILFKQEQALQQEQQPSEEQQTEEQPSEDNP
jgi:hypothetical protein